MLIFISGGVRSGKSTLGEKIASKIAYENKVYLATSKVYDEEMRARINKHQKDRQSEGFITIEKSEDIGEIISQLRKTDTVMMDCLGTLVANEMFKDYTKKNNESDIPVFIEKIFSDIINVSKSVSNMIVISNEIFSDGKIYDDATEKYIQVIGGLHIKIAAASDQAIECIYGHNIVHKGEKL